MRKRCEICSKLTIKTPERRHWRSPAVFIVNFEHFTPFSSIFLLTLNKQMLAGLVYQQYSIPPGAYSELFQTSKAEFFAKIVHGFQLSTTFARRTILDVWHGLWSRFRCDNYHYFPILLWLSVIEDEQKLYNHYQLLFEQFSCDFKSKI